VRVRLCLGDHTMNVERFCIAGPFAYAGTIKKVTITIQPSALGASDQRIVGDGERAAALAME